MRILGDGFFLFLISKRGCIEIFLLILLCRCLSHRLQINLSEINNSISVIVYLRTLLKRKSELSQIFFFFLNFLVACLEKVFR